MLPHTRAICTRRSSHFQPASVRNADSHVLTGDEAGDISLSLSLSPRISAEGNSRRTRGNSGWLLRPDGIGESTDSCGGDAVYRRTVGSDPFNCQLIAFVCYLHRYDYRAGGKARRNETRGIKSPAQRS